MANPNIERLRLRSISVDGLFGSLDYFIPLDETRPTVLTGANGSGKSTILRVVSAASSGDLIALATAPLRKLVLAFDRGPDFEMTKANPGFDLQWGRLQGQLALNRHLSELPGWAVAALEERQYDVESVVEDLFEYAQLSRAPFDEFRNVRDLLVAIDRSASPLRAPEWFPNFAEQFHVLFVTDQRLVTEARPRPSRNAPVRSAPQVRTTRLAVEAASADLADRIREADSDYARASQQLDRQLPQKILTAMTKQRPVSIDVLIRSVDRAAALRELLRSVGLLDVSHFEPDLTPETLQDENIRRVMNVVISSTLEKLSVLTELQSRLSTYKEFLDVRFAPKKLELDRANGIRFAVRGNHIRPRQLSSGEQQMMVLAYEILFRAKPGTLVVVDEPELSLHVLWQDTLIRDLSRMGEAAGVQFLLATHSPIILAETPELERPLRKAIKK